MRSTGTILLSALVAAPIASANPYLPFVAFVGQLHTPRPNGSPLELRDCPNPCGWQNQYCCGEDQTCITTAGDIAVCTAGGGDPPAAGGGSYELFTTTFVEEGPITVTSTGSYLITQVQTPVAGGSPVACPGNSNSCGSVCCGSNQYCQQPGLCANIGASQSAPIRPTSNVVTTSTSTGTAATTIVPSMPTGVASQQGVSSGLSPGAIAGIVIGVLVGLFLLFVILACLCCKGIIDGLLALLGCRRKPRRVEETVIESRHSHHGSGGRPPQRTWFGFARPGRTEVVEERKKKSSGMGGLLGVGAFLTALAVILGLKRRRDRERSEKDEGSYSSVSYYSYEDDYTTSASSASSDRRARSARGSARGSRR